MSDLTCCIIKPRAVAEKLTGPILQKIEEAGYNIIALKKMHMNRELAENFYSVHRGKDFFEDLINFMTSGPIVVMCLEKEKAVENFREFMGATDPAQASENTLRRMFGISVQKNAVHGSDSPENAAREINLLFQPHELIY